MVTDDSMRMAAWCAFAARTDRVGQQAVRWCRLAPPADAAHGRCPSARCRGSRLDMGRTMADADHRLPRRRQPHRPRGRAGAARAARPTSRSSGVAADYDELVAGADAAAPQVRRHRHPHAADASSARASRRPRRCASATPAPASSSSRSTTTPSTPSRCSSEGAAGYAYLLKDRVAEGDQLAQAIRDGRHRRLRCSTRRSSTRWCSPVTDDGGLTPQDEELLR